MGKVFRSPLYVGALTLYSNLKTLGALSFNISDCKTGCSKQYWNNVCLDWWLLSSILGKVIDEGKEEQVDDDAELKKVTQSKSKTQ